MGNDHVPSFEEQVLYQSVFPLWGDSCFADAEDVHQEELDGEAPTRDEGGWRASGTIGLEGADASSVEAFGSHVVPDARAGANVGLEEMADGEIEPMGIVGKGVLRAFRVGVQRCHDGRNAENGF